MALAAAVLSTGATGCHGWPEFRERVTFAVTWTLAD
jgi:hypothetical protein